MIDRFEELLKELGNLIHLPLHPDKNRSCNLTIDESLHLRLKIDDSQERLLISSFLTEIPAGRFREDSFKEMLKANYHYPRPAILAYTSKNNQLVAFDYISLIQLNGEKLAKYLTEFITYADEWRKAIERGQPGPRGATSAQKNLPSPFGLRP